MLQCIIILVFYELKGLFLGVYRKLLQWIRSNDLIFLGENYYEKVYSQLYLLQIYQKTFWNTEIQTM